MAESLKDDYDEHPHQLYFLMKKLFQADEGSPTPKSFGENTFWLGTCGFNADFGDADLPLNVGSYSELAYVIVHWRSWLRGLGYPDVVWRPMLIEYEEKVLKNLDDLQSPKQADFQQLERAEVEFRGKLASALNSYRKLGGKPLPAIEPGSDGCGDGEMAISMITDPPSGQIRMITEFVYKLCKADKLDPDDFKSCSGWWNVADKAKVSGIYRFDFRWPDGSKLDGKMDVTKIVDDKYILRKP